MANPIPFKPAPVDPSTEHARLLAAAPTEHAEAVLVAWDILQTAHDQGLLDTLHGLVGAKDFIAGTAATYAKLPESVAAIRNLIALSKIAATVDPEMLDRLSKAMVAATAEHSRETTPPSLFQIARRAFSEDSRRAFSYLTLVLTGLGRSLKR